MKRDMEIIREILFSVEEDNQDRLSETYDADTLKYHQELVVDAGLVKGMVMPDNQSGTPIPAAVFIQKLTWEGHEFLDAVRKDEIWNTIKREFKEESMSTVISVAKRLAEGWAKKRIEDVLNDNDS